MTHPSAANTTEIVAVFLISVAMGAAGCGTSKQADKPMPKTNEAILKEVNDGGLWIHAKKTRPIWARLLDKPERIKTLEGDEDVPAGQYLCRGEAGDIWPQAPERLNSKYVAADEVDADGWKKFLPHPDNQGVFAAQISRVFRVQAKWGLLSGKPGDFIVKNYDDRDVAVPDDIWIVDQNLFRATYETIYPR